MKEKSKGIRKEKEERKERERKRCPEIDWSKVRGRVRKRGKEKRL